jgi:hypothetical protein
MNGLNPRLFLGQKAAYLQQAISSKAAHFDDTAIL